MSIIKVNLGSGPNSAPGWINYDWGVLAYLSKHKSIRGYLIKAGALNKSYDREWPKIKLVNLKRRLPLNSDSVDYIYCSHLLEHLEKWEALNLLKECFRVLKRGAFLRVVVPDIDKLIKKRTDGDSFCRQWWGYEKDVERLANYFIRGHQWMYDEKSIVNILKAASFRKIEVLGFRKGMVPDINKLDINIHKFLSIYAEAEK